MRTAAPAMDPSKSLSSPPNRRTTCEARGEIVSKRLISYFGVVAVSKFDRNRRRTSVNKNAAMRVCEPGPQENDIICYRESEPSRLGGRREVCLTSY